LPKQSVGVIPAGSTIAECARKLEAFASKTYGLEIKETMSTHSPSFSFDFDIYVRLILDGYGLSKYAETGSKARPILLAHTMDGAQLTSMLGHVSAGIKIVDPRALDPVTGFPICSSYQSRDLCFPCQITFRKDCKALYTDCFKEFLNYFNGGLVVGGFDGLPVLSNFQMVLPQDMSSIWKVTGLGGGSQSTNLFCYCCHCTNKELAICNTGKERCGDCTELSTIVLFWSKQSNCWRNMLRKHYNTATLCYQRL
jgi:hypothetical protein